MNVQAAVVYNFEDVHVVLGSPGVHDAHAAQNTAITLIGGPFPPSARRHPCMPNAYQLLSTVVFMTVLAAMCYPLCSEVVQATSRGACDAGHAGDGDGDGKTGHRFRQDGARGHRPCLIKTAEDLTEDREFVRNPTLEALGHALDDINTALQCLLEELPGVTPPAWLFMYNSTISIGLCHHHVRPYRSGPAVLPVCVTARYIPGVLAYPLTHYLNVSYPADQMKWTTHAHDSVPSPTLIVQESLLLGTRYPMRMSAFRVATLPVETLSWQNTGFGDRGSSESYAVHTLQNQDAYFIQLSLEEFVYLENRDRYRDL